MFESKQHRIVHCLLLMKKNFKKLFLSENDHRLYVTPTEKLFIDGEFSIFFVDGINWSGILTWSEIRIVLFSFNKIIQYIMCYVQSSEAFIEEYIQENTLRSI